MCKLFVNLSLSYLLVLSKLILHDCKSGGFLFYSVVLSISSIFSSSTLARIAGVTFFTGLRWLSMYPLRRLIISIHSKIAVKKDEWSALFLPAISKAVPWSGEVRTTGKPAV